MIFFGTGSQVSRDLSEVHEYRTKEGNQCNQHRRHTYGIPQMIAKGFDFLTKSRIARQYFLFPQFSVENMRRTELDTVAHQDLIRLEYLDAEIYIQKEHSDKQADDDTHE